MKEYKMMMEAKFDMEAFNVVNGWLLVFIATTDNLRNGIL